MDIFLIPQHHSTLNVNCASEEDILFYMYRAYRNCCFKEKAPDIYDFYDNLMDELHLSGRRTFLFRGLWLSLNEICNPYFVESLLKDFRFQYTGEDGKEMCNCQNILIQEMIEDE